METPYAVHGTASWRRVRMKNFRIVNLYYRDHNKVMRKIDRLKVIIYKNKPDEVVYYPDNYTTVKDMEEKTERILLPNSERSWR